MQYLVYTRGKADDYSWKGSNPDMNFQDYLGGTGVLVASSGDGTYTVYLVSSPTETKDYQGRKISIAVLVSGCAEEKAKGLVAWALEHWDNFVETFTSFVIDFGKDEWTANIDAVKDWVDQIQEIAKTENAFENRTHNGNIAENRHNLLAELHKFDFKPKSGFKLVVSDELMTGGKLETLKSEVDRYLSGEGTAEILLDCQTVSVEKNKFQPTARMFYATLTMAVMSTIFLFVALGVATWFYGEYRPLMAEVLELEKEISLRENDNQRLREMYEPYRRGQKSFEEQEKEWANKIEEQRVASKKLQSENNTLTAKNVEERSRKKNLETEISELIERREQLKTDESAAGKKRDEIIRQIDTLRRELDELKGQVDSKRNELDGLNERPPNGFGPLMDPMGVIGKESPDRASLGSFFMNTLEQFDGLWNSFK